MSISFMTDKNYSSSINSTERDSSLIKVLCLNSFINNICSFILDSSYTKDLC